MNISNIKVDNEKCQSPLSTTARLHMLQSQMAASHFGEDHPWRMALSEIIEGASNAVPLRSCAEPVAAPHPRPDSLHKPFLWLPASLAWNADADNDADALDAFRGITTCLQLIEMSNLDRDLIDPSCPGNSPPVLDMLDTGNLMRLAILVATEWGNKAERRISKRTADSRAGGAK
ncbi:hypothetical protein F2P45_32175 [Massilia sp. CCM 8733]|uniref:Uncharacterized protein n=1 Tax=Massilia mucilaginosa TaxID=2609282 RepID=A0ABX0P2T0_9BURK|nr:hypothetical protein [Massilia mucilaginosa]NHZ93621.1 hypothetical protein [Massilia mucilaginosa]